MAWTPKAIVACAAAALIALSGAPAAHAQSGNDSSDQTLEIAPRIAPPMDAAPDTAPAAPPADSRRDDTNAATAPADNANDAATDAASVNQNRPYLGMTVQAIYAKDQPGQIIAGLEIISVDPGGPAARAGLHGRTKMTSLGESGATASALLPPLDIVMIPLLKRAGSLGRGGDLIVAIDGRRVNDNLDLQTALATLKPGDTIYLTVMRTMPDRSLRTLTLPLKLGAAADAMATAANGAQSSGAPAEPANR